MVINNSTLPLIVAGPIVRHVDSRQLNFWLVTTSRCPVVLCLFNRNHELIVERSLDEDEHRQVAIGHHAFVNLLSINFQSPLPEGELIYYDLRLVKEEGEVSVVDEVEGLLYADESLPSLVINRKLDKLLHGSCRKPHFDSADGLCQVDKLLATEAFTAEQRPSLLMMSGDQIYADDVAGPVLVAIHQVIELLGLFDENLQGALVDDSQSLYQSPFCYYHREQLLPHDRAGEAIYDKLFAASKKPIFTSDDAGNHLVTLAEVMAMYLLVWSPTLWRQVSLSMPSIAEPVLVQKYSAERRVVEDFVAGLASVRRAMAHLPVYMIFDDHDITDDWNLTRGWEETAYGNAFSKRILGNALIGYFLCQGWGNAPDKLKSLGSKVEEHFSVLGCDSQDDLIDQLLDWDQWHYSLATTPKLVVLDTRTQRWRSESRANKPSGLMDWESLSELQQELIDQPSVIMVSPAPIYGVKVIETIQRIFTFFGKPLLVDAENWMAHSGTANVMLNIFRHYRTPPNFIILSGDVHYSFVYEVTHRFRRNSSKIFQITCSGIKNQFPSKLLHCLAELNRYLYGRYSPLNWLTKRRRMRIKARRVDQQDTARLYNASGIGLLELNDAGEPEQTLLLCADGKRVHFR
ncbi:hypothetical protein EDC56_1619 [Sinobacterium caligoides]|uniref:PhoD-like phosphatase n=1 Tax=Sinobacterium caligoides TaxID=933926 RepID=A0A3N2DN04_9GAMM|nr:alkaline phosphatase family protein [Sinobacterium caligoides]ROS01191.1 hypothetical protein EDC56_1619 [Sinobacterium caligoides]